jgi:DNA-binding transcriptional regulator GbsR (MarR family)
MTKSQRIEKEITKTKEQLATIQAKLKNLEEEKRMAERAEKLGIIEKHKISSEKLQLLIKFSEDEILQLLAQKEKERTGNEEKVIS